MISALLTSLLAHPVVPQFDPQRPVSRSSSHRLASGRSWHQGVTFGHSPGSVLLIASNPPALIFTPFPQAQLSSFRRQRGTAGTETNGTGKARRRFAAAHVDGALHFSAKYHERINSRITARPPFSWHKQELGPALRHGGVFPPRISRAWTKVFGDQACAPRATKGSGSAAGRELAVPLRSPRRDPRCRAAGTSAAPSPCPPWQR